MLRLEKNACKIYQVTSNCDIDTVLGNMMKQTIKYPSGGLEECVVGSHQPFLININYHKLPLRIFLGGRTYCQNMQFKICGRSRSDLKISNNKHLLLQQPFLININYHKIPLRIFLGDIRIPP